jgi:hypothetical protein
MKKGLIAFSVAIMMVVVGFSVSATLPEQNENRNMDSTVGNTVPYFIYGWVDIMDQYNVLKWSGFDRGVLIDRIIEVEALMESDLQFDVDLDIAGLPDCIAAEYPAEFDRGQPYAYESESVWIYVIYADLSGSSDFWQHQLDAWLSPDNNFFTEMALTADFAQCAYDSVQDPEFMNQYHTVAIAKGEQFVDNVYELQCDHDIYLTLVDKYGDTSIPRQFDIIDHIFFNPYFGATFDPAEIRFQNVISCGPEIEASQNPYELHVRAFCRDFDGQGNPIEIPVLVNYELFIHGTDMEGISGSNNMHVIPTENVRYEWEHPEGGWFGGQLSCDEVLLDGFVTCTPIMFRFWVTPPCPIEPGDYHGEIGFGIAAV